ncbi:purple acid phosphatase family protein [Flavobacterium flavigenum]|uniref:purple acid phosphatase family protein n=1 Tax=Flavobacterium flavigenum TaxID=3003258 RepID=UPI0022AC8F59|nr:tartrate-resistant acid phosphatase type 5 family protein [Flavobacterium flavigenum]
MKMQVLQKNRLLLFICALSLNFAVAQTTDNSVKKYPNALNFIVMGDWGRFGEDHQIPVAKQMGKTATAINRDFIISTGDNFYPVGVASEHDPQWKSSFEDIYTDFSLHWNWYPVLGNHDYAGNADAQVAYSKISRRWNMPARYYSKTFNINGDANQQVLIAFIDTNALIPEFYKNEQYSKNLTSKDSTAQKKWLIKTLTDVPKTVKWKLVVGHHPLFTATLKRRESYDTKAVRKSLKSLFDKYQVDAYIAGHDHDLQHMLPEGKTHYFVSGSASEVTPIDRLPFSKLAVSKYGFMVFSVLADTLYVQAVNENGEVIYTTEIKK